jgi:superfamily II RNA helicase
MQAVTDAVRRFVAIELLQGVEQTIKEPDWGIAAAVDSWSRGGSVDDLERFAHTDAGDVVRTLRMAIQMMRQVRIAVGPGQQLAARLEEAIVSINREVVDAKRQFELG